MANSKLAIRILALLIYCAISASLLGLFLLTLDSSLPPPPMPPPHPPFRKLFRHHLTADSFDEVGGGEGAAALTAAAAATAADTAALELAGFRLPRLPATADGNASSTAEAEFFDLPRRRRLANGQPDSPEAATLRRNAVQLDFSFRLGVRPCTSLERIFVAVMTTANAAERRDAARATWMTEAAAAGARIAFFLAGDGGSSGPDARLAEESSRHGDLVLVPDFADTYRHLTLKVLAALDFACRFCPLAGMFAKVDDDSVLNLRALRTNWLDRYQRRFPGLQYAAGYRYETPGVKRHGRWRVSPAEYPLGRFPSYLFGGAYALRVNTCRVFAAASYFPVPPIEDAFVTGVLPAALGIRQAADNAGFACQFFNHAGSLNAAAFRRGLVMSGTDLTPQYVRSFWQRYLELGERRNATMDAGVSARS